MVQQHMEPAIKTMELTKKYRGVPVVDSVDLHVPQQQVYGFLGPNGAGKSTTLKLLLGLARPTHGSVHFRGMMFNQQSARQILPTVGSLIESPSFYGQLTGLENLKIVSSIKKLEADEAPRVLEMVGLSVSSRKLAKEYSLGMKQRLGIAMALLGNPQLLILDEPTNGLDPAGIHGIRELIKSLPELYDLTVLVSSHLLHEIEQMATTVGIINHGTLLYQGPLSGLEDRGSLLLRVDNAAECSKILHQGYGAPEKILGPDIYMPIMSEQSIPRLVRYVVSAGFQIYRVEVQKRSLEDVFLSITEGKQEFPNSVGRLGCAPAMSEARR